VDDKPGECHKPDLFSNAAFLSADANWTLLSLIFAKNRP